MGDVISLKFIDPKNATLVTILRRFTLNGNITNKPNSNDK